MFFFFLYIYIKEKEKKKEKKTCLASRGPLGRPLGCLLGRLEGLMEPSWGVLGASWRSLKLSMRVLERSRDDLGGLQSILAVSGALQDPRP